jgi:multidrug efflux pump subunit AcrA (membrane-fusion protein)
MMKPIHSLILRYALIAPLLLLIAACNPQQDDNWLVGQLESDRIEITSEFAEPIVSISVKEGQMVDADTVLLEQNSERVDNRLAEATAHSAQLQARLDELIRGPRKEKILAAQAKLQGIQSERD